ncbi:MAG: hypothetical protein AAB071_02140 [Bacteroidota bacterium]
MVEAKDIIQIPIEDASVEKANKYAMQSLHFTYNRMHLKNPSQRFRNIAFGKIMECTFEQLLKEKHISYDTFGETHYTQIDKYDIGINKHRCDIKGFFLRSNKALRELNKSTSWLLDCCALVPTDQLSSEKLKLDDFYIFAFMTANVRDIKQENILQSIIIQNGNVYFCGYITKNEFYSSSTKIPSGFTLCKQYSSTKTDNNMMKVHSLHPMKDLLS